MPEQNQDRSRDHIFVPIGAVAALIGLFMLATFAPREGWTFLAAAGVAGVGLYTLFRDLSRYRAQLTVPAPVSVVESVVPEGPLPHLGFEAVLRAMPDPVMIISGIEPNDIAGRWIVFANTAAVQQFNAREGSLLVSALRIPEVLEAADEALFGNVSRDTLFETSGAQDMFWRAWTSPLAVRKNASTGMDSPKRLALMVVRDETDTRRIERMRADFLANASHELRTPLASLTGFIETLRGHAKDDLTARDKFLNIMAAQADRMGRLINDLLSLSRIEMNEHVPPSGEADPVLVVRDVVDGLSILAQEKNVRFRVIGPAHGQYRLVADRDQLLQVIQNLSDNALKYAPRGSEVTIEIALDLTFDQAISAREKASSKLVLLRPDRSDAEYYCLIRVRDNGPGIRREFLPRLAERFYRVEGQKSGDRLGTGLGLAIVKHIVNRHRGGLLVESVGAPSPDERELMGLNDLPSEPVEPVPTFTAFSAYFPQSRRFSSDDDGLLGEK